MPQSVQGYHFPPPEPEPSYPYTPQPLGAQQQWGPPADPHGYELSYQGYNDTDPPPFHNHQPAQAYPEQEADYGGDDYFEDEEPRSSRRWVWIAAAVVGAIGVGGVLAYTYKSLVAPNSGRVPIAKVEAGAKAKPDFRGAAAERKLPTRPTEETQSTSEPEASADTANVGPRVVRPIPITPGGAAPASESPPPPPPASVPGITLYQPPAPPQPPARSQALPAPQPPAAPAPAPQAAPQAPSRVALGTRPPAAEVDDDPPASAPRRPPVQPAAVTPSRTPPTPAPAPSRSASSGLGYVAVLKSSKTSMEALQTFADMQQQYPEVLTGKTPDVQTADLSSRGLGTMYRLVVGPPGSHNAARSVCSQLKTAGYEGCWVKEY